MDLNGGGLRRARVLEVDPASPLSPGPPGASAEAPEPIWLEKNCYVDLWTALLHALELDARALWPFTLALDFEGDQWTFFKPPHGELRDLYGIDVQELTLWRPLAGHAIEFLGAGRLVSVEVDAFWLPDTAGTDYRERHAKTTIVLNEIDLDARRLGYFHNTAYCRLEGEDFSRVMGMAAEAPPADSPSSTLPLFAEFIRLDRLVRRTPEELRTLAAGRLRHHLDWRPPTNPVRRFASRLEADLPLLRERGLAHYHLWAFNTLRQLGGACELAARGLEWQGAAPGSAFFRAAQSFDAIARASKTLILKMARVVTSPRPPEPGVLAPALEAMAGAWDQGMAALEEKEGVDAGVA